MNTDVEPIYVVVRACAGTQYQKTLFVQNGDCIEIPYCRIDFGDNCRNAHNRTELVAALVSHLLETEFRGIKLTDVRQVAHIGKSRLRIFLVNSYGWPEPLDERFRYVFADHFQCCRATKTSLEILEKVEQYLAQEAIKITQPLVEAASV